MIDGTSLFADLDSRYMSLLFRLRPGHYYPSLFSAISLGVGTATASANRYYAALFPVPRKSRFDRIALDYYGTPAVGKGRLGIYNCNSVLYPSNLVLNGGEIDLNQAPPPLELTIDQTLDSGLYFLVFVLNINRTLYANVRNYISPLVNQSTNYIGFSKSVISYPATLPDPFPTGAGLESSLYSIYLRFLEHP